VLDIALLILAVAGGAVTAGCVLPAGVRIWLSVPTAGLAITAGALNWCHAGAGAAPEAGDTPAPPTFVVPVAGPVTAGYQSYDRSHSGVDIGVPEGTPVLAPASGEVLHAGPLEQWGYAVWIKHSDGWSSFFAHLERPAVRRGALVKAGVLIGWSGTSGISTGPHVHVELRYRGRPVDPEPMRRGARE
jgi:murein DD-endopeptidase MepM/ murein hydrolase activator NlpD